ncbi:MAG: hypothetical protein JNK82_33000 [Myxococcaceae bacterium]|nr:hypothetical protein [Myxococcaceae bacterium]
MKLVKLTPLLAALVLVACTGSPPVVGKCSQTGAIELNRQDDFGVAGEPATKVLRLPMTCPPEVEMRATVTVLGPDNLPVPLSEGEPTRVLSGSDRSFDFATVTAKVLPAAPGPYHFTARFEPNLGSVQGDLLIAENHRDAGPELTVRGAGGLGTCSLIDVTPGGRLLCLTASRLSVYDPDGGARTQTLPGVHAAHVSGVLWVYDPPFVRRYIEEPSGFVLHPMSGVSTNVGTNRGVIAADASGAMIGLFPNLYEAVLGPDGGIRLRTDYLQSASLGDALWKRRDEYLSVGDGRNVCHGRFLDAGDLCNGFEQGAVLASEPAGIWSLGSEPFQPELRSLALRTGAIVRQLPLTSGWSAEPPDWVEWDTGAVILDQNTGRRLFVADKGGTFMLQTYPALPVLSVTSRWVALRNANDDVLLYSR